MSRALGKLSRNSLMAGEVSSTSPMWSGRTSNTLFGCLVAPRG
jgi:hypothetical protein